MSDETAPNTVQVIVRVPEGTRERWHQAAEKAGFASTSEFIRHHVDAACGPVLECQHPKRRVYPWSETCLVCGERLRG